MIYLCCDTNVWIDISNGYEPARLLDKLHSEISNDNVKLILPSIILDEWKRNKKKSIIDRIHRRIEEQIEVLKELSGFLKQEYSDSFDEFFADKITLKLAQNAENLKDEIKKYENKIIEKANKNISKVEEIFSHKNTVKLEIEEKTAFQVLKIFSEKQFPFDDITINKNKEKLPRNKNNFADCLIFYQFINYLECNDIKGTHFVTSNEKDFYQHGKLHQSYSEQIQKSNSYFHLTLSSAMNDYLNEQFISLNELQRIERIAKYKEDFERIESCLFCEDVEEKYGLADAFVTLEASMKIKDFRISEINHNQGILFDDFLDFDKKPGFINRSLYSGACIKCDNQHFICPECDEVQDYERVKLNQIDQCLNCELPFIIKKIRHHNNREFFEFHILTETGCEKCGNSFIQTEVDSTLCDDCLVI